MKNADDRMIIGVFIGARKANETEVLCLRKPLKYKGWHRASKKIKKTLKQPATTTITIT